MQGQLPPKTQKLQIRLSKTDKKAIVERSRALGLTVSAYVVSCATGKLEAPYKAPTQATEHLRGKSSAMVGQFGHDPIRGPRLIGDTTV